MDSVVYRKEDCSFQQISQSVSELEVINDAAKRSVQFDSDYNKILTTTTKHILGRIKTHKTSTDTPNFSKNI